MSSGMATEAGVAAGLIGREAARARGFRVLVAQPAEAERALSFATLSDLLAETAEEIGELTAPLRRPLAAALLLEEAEGVPVEPRAVAMGLLALLRALARERP